MSKAKGKQTRRFIIFFLLLIIDVSISLSFAELWVRLFVKEVNLVWQHDSRLGIMLAPKQKRIGYVEGKYYNIIETNNYGFVDEDWSIKKHPETIRIEAFGDSFLAGLQTNSTITHLLEKSLNSVGRIKFDIMNFGMVNGGTAKELACYQSLGQKFEHDAVMLFFMANDIRDNHPRLSVAGNTNPYFLPSKDGNLMFLPPRFNAESRVVRFVKKNVYLSHVLANKILQSRFFQEIQQIIKTLSHHGRDVENHNMRRKLYREAVDVTLKLIYEFNRQARLHGADFILLDCEPISAKMKKHFDHKLLRMFCNRNGISYVPVYKVYRTFSENSESYRFIDGHLKPEANLKIARFIAKNMELNHLARSTVTR